MHRATSKVPSHRSSALGAGGAETIADELTRLAALDVGQLRVQYRNRMGRIAPARISRALLIRVLGYQAQAGVYGDLSRDTRRMLDHLASSHTQDGATSSAPVVDAPMRLKPGTVLVREWQGRMEHVTVTADGFAWSGKPYASLSATAFAISGTKWNGYRFFGLPSLGSQKAAGKQRRETSPANRHDKMSGSDLIEGRP